MTRLIDRRAFGFCCAGVFIPPSTPQPAPKQPALQGEWSPSRDATAQVTVASYGAVGFFWGYDYFEPRRARFSDDGGRLDFAFRGGKATLTRTGPRTALLVVEEGGNTTRLEMQRD